MRIFILIFILLKTCNPSGTQSRELEFFWTRNSLENHEYGRFEIIDELYFNNVSIQRNFIFNDKVDSASVYNFYNDLLFSFDMNNKHIDTSYNIYFHEFKVNSDTLEFILIKPVLKDVKYNFKLFKNDSLLNDIAILNTPLVKIKCRKEANNLLKTDKFSMELKSYNIKNEVIHQCKNDLFRIQNGNLSFYR